MIPYILLPRSNKPLHSFSPSIRPVLLPPKNTQHRGCAWVKHYNSSRKWPFLRNFQGAVKGRRLMPGQALQGTGTPPSPPSRFLSSLTIFFTPLPSHHLHTANNGMSHANERFANQNCCQTHIYFAQSRFTETLLVFAFCFLKGHQSALRTMLHWCAHYPSLDVFISLRLTWWNTPTSKWLSFENCDHFNRFKDRNLSRRHVPTSFCRGNQSPAHSFCLSFRNNKVESTETHNARVSLGEWHPSTHTFCPAPAPSLPACHQNFTSRRWHSWRGRLFCPQDFSVSSRCLFLPSLCPSSAALSVHASHWLSLIISPHPTIDALDTEVCSASLSPSLPVVCLQSCCLSLIIPPAPKNWSTWHGGPRLFCDASV